MYKLDLNNRNVYERSIISYRNEVDEFWTKIKHDVDLLKHHYFFFDNPWDMERCTYIYKKHGLYFFNKTPNSDPEWVFQLCRFEWLSKFILLFYKTNDISLLNEWERLITIFFNSNNYKNNGQIIIKKSNTIIDRAIKRICLFIFKPSYPTYRTLDTAIRNYSLLINIVRCPKLLERVSVRQILHRIQNDSEFTYNNLRKFDETSNWGIIIVCSHLICNLIIDVVRSDYNVIITKLIGMLNKQILPNGAHIESSHMYHNQVLLYLLRLVFWADKCNFVLPNELLLYVRRMAKYSRDFVTPDETQDLFGDSDNTSLSTLLALSDVILGNVKKLPIIKNPDFILLNEFDFEYSQEEYSKICVGNYTKDGITRLSLGDYVVFIYNTKFYSSHKHSDNGSFTLYYKNIPVVIDSGRYSYYDSYWREYFKSVDSHSTIYVSGDSLISDIYSKSITEIENEIFISDENIQAYVSYRVYNKWKLSRRFKLTSQGLEIHDEYCCCEYENPVIQNIIFHPDIKPTGARTFTVAGRYKLRYETDYDFSEVIQAWISHHYNEKVKSYKIRMNGILTDKKEKITKIMIDE